MVPHRVTHKLHHHSLDWNMLCKCSYLNCTETNRKPTVFDCPMGSGQFSSLLSRHSGKLKENEEEDTVDIKKSNLCYTDNHLCSAPECTAGRAACSLHCDEERWRAPPWDCPHIRGGGKVSKSNKWFTLAHCAQDTGNPLVLVFLLRFLLATQLNVKMDREKSIQDGEKQVNMIQLSADCYPGKVVNVQKASWTIYSHMLHDRWKCSSRWGNLKTEVLNYTVISIP